MHLKEYHPKGEAKELGQTKKAPSQHGTQLKPDTSPEWSEEVAVAGPSGVSLLNAEENPMQNLILSGNSWYHDPTCTLPRSDGEQSLREVTETLMRQQRVDHSAIERLNQQVALLSTSVQVLEQRQSVDRSDIAQLKRQLTALADSMITERRNCEQLQNEVRVVEGKVHAMEQQQAMDHLEKLKQKLVELAEGLATEKRQGEQLQEEVRTAADKVQALEQHQSMDQNATEQLKRQLAVFADEFAVEKQDRQRLQDEVRTADGKIQLLEQELEAEKNACASAQAECVSERDRGIEALNVESGLLQEYIGRLQNGLADMKRSHTDLEARLRHFEDERLLAFNIEGL